MSTHSNIGILNDDGSVSAVYCHSDGYIAYNGRLLAEHYCDYAKAKKIIALGYVSSLGVEPIVDNDSRAKTEDPNEDGMVYQIYTSRHHHGGVAENYPNVKEYAWYRCSEYTYLYVPTDNCWYLVDNHGGLIPIVSTKNPPVKPHMSEILEVLTNSRSLLSAYGSLSDPVHALHMHQLETLIQNLSKSS